jgi:hypothetical protein
MPSWGKRVSTLNTLLSEGNLATKLFIRMPHKSRPQKYRFRWRTGAR